MPLFDYKPKQKVVYVPERKIYDFGCYSKTEGRAVIYEEGECNTQDAHVVWIGQLQPYIQGICPYIDKPKKKV